MAMANFDVSCKELISDLGKHLDLIPKSSYSIDPQAEIESITGFRSEEKSLPFTIDIVWLRSLCPTMGRQSWTSKVLSDIVVAWEVDSTHDLKRIRTSIDNLATLNPRLGIELLLIGGYKGAINGFDSRFKTAIHAARMKTARIIVIHDVIFSQLYFRITNRHPEQLYTVYLEAARKPELSILLKQKWRGLLEKTETEADFERGLEEKLLDKLNARASETD